NGRSVPFPIETFARYCLLNGVDELGFLLSQQDRIAAYERAQP
ncbi:MAG: 3-isopropylmalate dehydratase small subunit, partial [Gemmatimonadetes bacterium]|nr:3-isopropylmalate dehydratase small subunit [Gemmatimonadota bacterium]